MAAKTGTRNMKRWLFGYDMTEGLVKYLKNYRVEKEAKELTFRDIW